jgi:hypothetical protein
LPRLFYKGMTMKLLMIFALQTLLTLNAQTVIVNLSSDDVYVARQYYTDGSSSISAGEYNLPVYSPAGWYHRGWKKIEPGEGYTADSTVLFLKYSESRPITYSDLDTTFGYVKHGDSFTGDDGFLARANQQQSGQQMRDRGFEGVNFMKFKDGVYRVSGDRSYELETKEFDVNHESRSIQFLRAQYDVPGKLVHHEFTQTESKWTKDISWRVSESAVSLGGYIEGRQVRIGGPREPAKFKGRLKIWYTTRR